MAMKPEVKQQWLKALRGRGYQQGHGYLRVEGRFCCLGVLCDLHAKATGGGWVEYNGRVGVYEESSSTLSDNVIAWAGLRSDDPRTRSGLALSDLNDGDEGLADPATFRQIADIIESEF